MKWINPTYNDCYVIFGVGINEQSKKPSFTVFPNPLIDFAIVELSEFNKKWTWMLYDSFGQCLQNISNISDAQLKIIKGDLSAGIYFYQVRTDDSLIGLGKLIIE